MVVPSGRFPSCRIKPTGSLLLLLLFDLVIGIFPRKKKIMKKIKVWSSTNPGGRKTRSRRAKAPR